MTNTSTYFSQNDMIHSIKTFLNELPDANTYKEATIEEYFLIEGKEVKLSASKTKGIDGLIWNINILD